MKFLISTVLIAFIGALMQIVLPWWSLVLAGMLIGIVVALPLFQSFLSGLLGTALVWWAYAWLINMKTDALLSNKIAMVFHVSSPFLIILVSGILAGLAGGLAAATGSALRSSVDSQSSAAS